MTSRPAQTIFALSSGHGRAGVAVIRISGPESGLIVDRMAAPRPKPRYAAFRRIRHPDTAEILDEALVLWLPGPATETGEDTAEFQVHGSPAVLRAVFQALEGLPNCRLAEPGEFARRAFGSGKLDLTAAEGLADLIDAETEAQRRQALAQAGGGLARLYDGWRAALLDARALVEAAIDFSDEADVATDALAQARARIPPLRDAIAGHLADGHRGEIVREGFRVVLAGSPNVGKSSLLNALARRDVAIVSDEAGTTRDALEVRLDLGGYAVALTDTAGLREATGAIEREGIRRSRAHARDADLILWIADATDPASLPNLEEMAILLASESQLPQSTTPASPEALAARLLVVTNKADLAPAAATGTDLRVSARTGQGLDQLIRAISGRLTDRLGSASALVPSQLRHRRGLSECLAALERYLANPPDEAELRAEDLRLAADALGRIVGRIDSEEVLDSVFSRFCIGK